MEARVPVLIFPGFSPVNRSLMYASMMLGPTQTYFSLKTDWPCSVGLLAFNAYQVQAFFVAHLKGRLHALSLVPVYYQTMCSITYLGSSAAKHDTWNVVQAFISTVLLLVGNFVSMLYPNEKGYGVYEFFFFGYRTFSSRWESFLTCWETFNWMLWMSLGVTLVMMKEHLFEGKPIPYSFSMGWTGFLLLVIWPFVLWTELIVYRNNIVSDTDMNAVYLFASQIGTMIIPTIYSFVRTSPFCIFPYGLRRDSRESGIPLPVTRAHSNTLLDGRILEVVTQK